MAIWQYDIYAVPRDELVSALGTPPKLLSEAQYAQAKFWQSRQPYIGFDAEFSSWRAELPSWSPGKIRLWGAEDSNRIDVGYRSGNVRSIKFRVEIRSLSAYFVELIAAFSRKANCVLLSGHTGALIEPDRQTIMTHIIRSQGANLMLDVLVGARESSKTTPRLFLSHSSLDKPFVGRLASDLKNRGVPVWFDQWELKVGDSLTQKIEDGISGSGWLAVVLSTHSVNSEWVQKELRAAQAKELRDKNIFVLPLVVDDCEIPLFLLDKLYADFRSSYEEGLDALLRRVTEGS